MDLNATPYGNKRSECIAILVLWITPDANCHANSPGNRFIYMLLLWMFSMNLRKSLCLCLKRQLTSSQKTHISTVLLGKLDQVGTKRLRCLFHPLVDIDRSIAIPIGPLEDTLNLLFL
jgi:hypothetical protein